MLISTSVMSLNIYYLGEFLSWANEVKIPTYTNVVDNRFSLKHLSDKAKEKIKNRLIDTLPTNSQYQLNPITPDNNWIVMLMCQDTGKNKNKFYLDLINQIDALRSQSYKTVFPEMYNILYE
jgi:hypothetical protein